MNVNVNLMEENVIHINGGITINNHVNVKNVMYVKKIMLGILLHVIVKMENIYKVLWIIQRYVKKLIDSTHDETKTIPTNFNDEKTIFKMQNYYI